MSTHDAHIEGQWIEVCRTGTWRDRFDRDVELTEEKFDRMVTQYDPTQREAPAVIGHPTLNSPAYAWVEALRRNGDRLEAKFKDVVHEFAEGVRKKMWPKRSIKFDGDMNLIHVGFLGAAPPAVPGLAPIEFITQLDGIEVEYEFADWRMSTVGELFRRIRDWILSEKDMETADRIVPPDSLSELAESLDEIPEWYRNQVDDHERRLQEIEVNRTAQSREFSTMNERTAATETTSGADEQTTAVQSTASEPTPSRFAGHPSNGGDGNGGSDLALLDRVQRLEAENAALRERTSVNEFSTFLDSSEMSERVTPAMREGTIELFRVLRSGPKEFEFAAGEATDPVEFFKRWLRKLPKSIELGHDPRMAERDGHAFSGGSEDEYAREGDAIAASGNQFKIQK